MYFILFAGCRLLPFWWRVLPAVSIKLYLFTSMQSAAVPPYNVPQWQGRLKRWELASTRTSRMCCHKGSKPWLVRNTCNSTNRQLCHTERILISLSRCVIISFSLVISAAEQGLFWITATVLPGDASPSLCLFPALCLPMIIICTKNRKERFFTVNGRVRQVLLFRGHGHNLDIIWLMHSIIWYRSQLCNGMPLNRCKNAIPWLQCKAAGFHDFIIFCRKSSLLMPWMWTSLKKTFWYLPGKWVLNRK